MVPFIWSEYRIKVLLLNYSQNKIKWSKWWMNFISLFNFKTFISNKANSRLEEIDAARFERENVWRKKSRVEGRDISTLGAPVDFPSPTPLPVAYPLRCGTRIGALARDACLLVSYSLRRAADTHVRSSPRPIQLYVRESHTSTTRLARTYSRSSTALLCCSSDRVWSRGYPKRTYIFDLVDFQVSK